MEMAAKLHRQGVRACTPKLHPCIVSHAGELSAGALQTVGVITKAFVENEVGQGRKDGLTKQRLSAGFRTRLLDRVMSANAKGFGQALRAAGSPRPSRSVISSRLLTERAVGWGGVGGGG